MAETKHHGGFMFLGTAADRAAYDTTGLRAGAQWVENDTDTIYTWNGTGWFNFSDWPAGNVTYVPLTGDIQTYVDAATAGDTLVLASGAYNITSTITINKQLNIRGQGNAGLVTAPITPGHGTLISSATAAITAFSITNDNVRLAHLSINLTGAGSSGITTANNLSGIVCHNIDVIVTCTGLARGFTLLGSNAVLRDLTYYITSTNGSASGTMVQNNAATTQAAVVDCFGVTGTAVGASGYAYALACLNTNNANTLTLNLSNSVCRVLAGTANDVGVVSYSVTTNNAIVNCYLCTLDGADYDAYQTGTNELNLGGSVLVNDSTFGTVTYRAAMVADTIRGIDLALTGDVTFTGDSAGLAYGSCYGNEIGWTQAGAVQNTWYEISDADMADGQLHNVTHDGSGKLTVANAGRYLCNWAISAEADAINQHIQITFSVSGTETNDGMTHFETFAASRQSPASSCAILDLAASATVEVSIRTTDAGAPDISVDHLNITVVQVGGT